MVLHLAGDIGVGQHRFKEFATSPRADRDGADWITAVGELDMIQSNLGFNSLDERASVDRLFQRQDAARASLRISRHRLRLKLKQIECRLFIWVGMTKCRDD